LALNKIERFSKVSFLKCKFYEAEKGKRGMIIKVIRTLIAVGIILLLFSVPVKSGEIRLKNGDRLTGEIIKMDGAVIVLKTVYAGKLSIKRNQVVCVKTTKKHIFLMHSQKILAGRAECSSEGLVEIVNVQTKTSETLALNALKAINPPPGTRWKGNVVIGGSMASGNTDSKGANLSSMLQVRTDRHRGTMRAKGNYNETDDAADAQNASGSLKYDYFLNKKLFTYGQVLIEHDKFQDLDLRYTIGPGLGYQFIESSSISLFAEAGISYVNENREVSENQDYTSGRWSIGFDWQIIPDRLKFFHLHEGYFRVEAPDDFFLRSQQGFRLPLAHDFYATFEFDYDYSNRPATGKKNSDRRYIFGLTYEFENY
jgi:putative salt-induced outer membrane protein YdiY